MAESPDRLPRLCVIADVDFLPDIEAWHRKLAQLACIDPGSGQTGSRQTGSRQTGSGQTGSRQTGSRGAGSSLAVQIRARSLDGDALRRVVSAARDTVPSAITLVLNGHVDLAAAAGYDGVHLPEGRLTDLAAAAARPFAWISASAHSTVAARRAVESGARAVFFSPVYRPTWKDAPAAGLTSLREAASAAAVPTFALGGVTPERVAACLEAGAHGVAVLSGVMGASDLPEAVETYLARLDGK